MTVARHLTTKVPDGTQSESRVKRFAQWVRNDKITAAVYVVPYAMAASWDTGV
jgi:hypothetical protein